MLNVIKEKIKKKKPVPKIFFKKSFQLSDESQGSENMSFKTSSNLCCEFIQSLTSSYLNINKQGKTNTWSFHKNRIHLKSHLLRVKGIWNSQSDFTVLENIPLNKQESNPHFQSEQNVQALGKK